MNILLNLSIFLILIALFIILSFRIIKIAKSRNSWIVISVGFLLLLLKLLIDLLYFNKELSTEIYQASNFIAILVILCILTGLILIRNSFKNIHTSEARKVNRLNRYKNIFNSSSDMIFVLDSDNNFIDVNEEACRMLGYNKTELMTMRFSDIKSSKYLNIIHLNKDKIKEAGQYIFESEHVTKEGKIVPVEINAKIIDINKQQYILCIARNISERKEIEKQVLSAIIETEEKERSRFAKDLHDGLGPLLSTIKLYVNELSSDDIEKKEKEDFIKYTNELIDEAVSNTRNISNDLTPQIIDDYGLIKSIDSFCNKINAIHKLEIHFKHANIPEQLDKPIELSIFRIIIELINNTIKHANAQTIKLWLEYSNQKLILNFKDDGIGFDANEAIKKGSSGIGLVNIVNRVNSLKGSCDFLNKQGQGASIKIKIDIENTAAAN